MNEKIKTIILIFIFFIVVIGIAVYMNNRELNNNSEESMKNLDNTEIISSNNKIIEVNEENFEAEVLKSDKKVLIDFYATWCGPCKMLHPIIEEIAKENSDLKVVQIDVDKCEELAVKNSVSAMPTLIVMENGNEVNRLVGLNEKKYILKICGK